MLTFAAFIRYRFKLLFYELIDLYSILDAWYGMAMAVKQFKLIFPHFVESDQPVLVVDGLYHILVEKAVAYDVTLGEQKNFIFLTGANMAGKSTFIRAVGISLFLAHLGMGVPAESMKVSLFEGILTNINVKDNVIKGESFFYNEVMRIKNTILKVSDKRRWLVLIDELFKGTNIQDAMKCSTAVIKGLVKIRKSLFILSTHLYEIGEELKGQENIEFKYFQTEVVGDELKFNYKILDGISNDRLGYFILKSERVTDLLDNI
jgi:DNA mismatch repair ATPase MutS